MLRAALNAVTFLHSRPALLKRLGNPDTYSPCRITPSNFFRFLSGAEYTTIRGVEFIIPKDSMYGQFSQKLEFSAVPDAGTFSLKFGASTTDPLDSSASAATIQAALRLIAELVNVVVYGNTATGFTIVFVGFDEAPALLEVVSSTLTRTAVSVTTTVSNYFVQWADPIKKGDRILDGQKVWSVDEIIEMHDLGAQVMGYRCRAD